MPIEAEVSPLPRELTTPPVTKICLAIAPPSAIPRHPTQEYIIRVKCRRRDVDAVEHGRETPTGPAGYPGVPWIPGRLTARCCGAPARGDRHGSLNRSE